MYRNLEEVQKAFAKVELEKQLEALNEELDEINASMPEMAADMGIAVETLNDIEEQADKIFKERYGDLDILKIGEQRHLELYGPILEELLLLTSDSRNIQ